MSAPLLYMNGHTAPRLTVQETARLKEFLDRGGILFAEACCNRRAFDAGFRELIRRAFPGRQLERLPPDHEVFRSYYRLSPKAAPLEGLNLGCRTGVIYTRKDISCDLEKTIHGNQAFKVGMNIAVYAMGDSPLRDKLDEIVLKPRKKAEEAASDDLVPRGALTIAQIKHRADWNTDPLAIRHLQAHLRKEVNVTVSAQRLPLELTSPELPNFPVLFVTGHRELRWSEEERKSLKQHLLRGGFLFAEACCGRESFDKGFRREMKGIFPDKALRTLEASHPVFSCGYPVETVSYKPRVLREKPGFKAPHLEGIVHEGRSIVIYSPYSLGCSLEGHSCPSCRGVEADDAYKLASNILIYALGF